MSYKFCDTHEESQRQLASLANPNLLPHNKLLLANLRDSQGPFLRLCDDLEVFDARQSAPPQIGYNASPLFGSIHYLENWLGASSAISVETQALHESFNKFLARNSLPEFDRSQPAVAINRAYVSSFICDQYSDQAENLHANIRSHLDEISKKFKDVVFHVAANELTFSLAPTDAATRRRLLETRLQYRLLFDVQKSGFQFTLHLGFRSQHLVSFWAQVEAWLASATGEDQSSTPAKTASNYQFHARLLHQKLDLSTNTGQSENANHITPRSYLLDELNRILPEHQVDVQILTQENYRDYRQQILDMQSEVYEPARQTPPEEFDALFDDSQLRHTGKEVIDRMPLAVVVLENGKIISMAFAGPLDMFTCERGVSSDPHLNHPTTYYMLDLTVVEAYRGKLGRLMKNAITLLATQSGVHAIHGRNRERLARGMWAINLSLGSYELQHLPDDYPDQHQYRDCIYYRCPLNWTDSNVKTWSMGNTSPLYKLQLSDRFISEGMPVIVNQHHDSLTPSVEFIKELDFLASQWPTPLRHVLATCHPRETGQQIWNSTRSHRSKNQSDDAVASIICTNGCGYNFPDECEVVSVANPRRAGKVQYLEQLKAALKDDSKSCTGVVVEPIARNSCDRISNELLKSTIELCRDFHVPIIFVESASLLYRYGDKFAASCTEELVADIVVAQLGESMSVLLGQKEYQSDHFFHGGEAIGLFGFNEMVRFIRRDQSAYLENINRFDQMIRAMLDEVADRFQIENGVGWIEGNVPENLLPMLQQNENGRYLVNPSYGQIRQFI